MTTSPDAECPTAVEIERYGCAYVPNSKPPYDASTYQARPGTAIPATGALGSLSAPPSSLATTRYQCAR